MATTVEQVKDRLSIVEVVSEYLKLDKAGVNFKANCPFHNEKTSSFFVSPARNSFHCFGCHKGGDVFSFIQEIEGVEFKEALKMLADKAGVEITNVNVSKTDNNRHKVLRDILRQATESYVDNIKTHKNVLDYLIGRGLTQKTITDFSLGFSLPDWQGVTDQLLAKGFKTDDLVAVGLAVYKKDDRSKVYDRFRSRIMFPLKDGSGNVVGFSGRIYGDHPEEAKYINSPQTVVYDKSKILYGLDVAKVNIRRQDEAVLVEGQMDMVMCHQVGIDNVVAVSGTALTVEHLTSLKRLSNNLVMAFDADKAGVEASKRAVEIALNLGLEVRIAVLPSGLDPADVAKDNPDKLKDCIKKSTHVIDFYLQVVTASESDLRLRARKLKQEVYSLIDKLAHITDKAHFVKKIADITNLSEEIIWADLKNLPTTITLSSNIRLPAPLVSEPVTTRCQKIIDELMGIRFFLLEHEEGVVAEIDNKIIAITSDLFLKANIEKSLTRQDELILATEITYGDVVSVKSIVKELLVNLERELLKEELKKITQDLKSAEATNNSDLIDKILKKCQNVSDKLNQL